MAVGMRMSPIDQPLMPMELLGRRSPAPVQDIASRILGSTWCAGFTFNGITAYGDGHDSLISSEELSDAGTWPKASVAEPLRDQLLELCRQRLDAFREQREEEVFAHRCRHRSPISGSSNYRVHRCAQGRCECCGAGCCSANPAPAGPGDGTHHPLGAAFRAAVEPGRLRRHQQPAGALLPLQRRQARRLFAYARGRPVFRCGIWLTRWAQLSR